MTDLKNTDEQRHLMEGFFRGYQAFTAKPDEMLARRGLSRVHHRILFFIARSPGLSVSELLQELGVSKQALNTPLRQLIEMGLVSSDPAADDKRKRLLALSAEGDKLERALRREQLRLLQQAYDAAGEAAIASWHAVNEALSNRPSRPAAKPD